MFGTKNVKLLKDGVMIDNQVLINYIVNNLGGVVGEQYAAPQAASPSRLLLPMSRRTKAKRSSPAAIPP